MFIIRGQIILRRLYHRDYKILWWFFDQISAAADGEFDYFTWSFSFGHFEEESDFDPDKPIFAAIMFLDSQALEVYHQQVTWADI